MKNQHETDIDCGSNDCVPCAAGRHCIVDDDCASAVCTQKTCAVATCTDFTRNGNETGVDCGGGCAGCAVGGDCQVGSDCASAVCAAGVCQPARCDDGAKNGSESDTDCGASCTPCALGATCSADADCASDACAGTCAASIRVDLLCSDAALMSMSPHPFFRVINTGKVSVPLGSLSLRYYFSKEPAGTEGYSCFYAGAADCSTITSSFGGGPGSIPTASRYLQIGFVTNAPNLAPGKTEEIRGGYHVDSYANFAQDNDYSFSTDTGYAPADHVTLYLNGILIWGVEPH